MWVPTVNLMLDYLVAATHPDGEIALFNDAALNVALLPHELCDYARRLGVEMLTDSAEWFRPTAFP